MVESYTGCLGLFQTDSILDFALSKSTSDLLRQRLVIPELVEERFVEEILDVFGVVERGRLAGRFRCFLLVSWLTRVDSYANT